MSRIGTYGASQQYLTNLLNLQSRTHDEELQVSSGKIAQNYSGIAQAADTVLNFQVKSSEVTQYQTNNAVTTTKLQAAGAAVDGIKSSITNFRNQLQAFQQTGNFDEGAVNQIQTFAFQTLQDVQAYLGTNVSGEYLFAGGKTSTVPMQMEASTLAQFQAQYNGSTITYPTTGGANLLNINLSAKQNTSLSFQPSTGTIVAAQADALSAVVAGSTITVANSNLNNSDYTVRSQAATNRLGQALGETTAGTGAGTTAQITYGSSNVALTNATTGNLNFAFNPNGNMTITPTNANTLAGMTIGTKFTVSNSTGNAWDGSFVVTGYANGVMTIANDDSEVKPEQVASSSISLTDNTQGTTPTLTAGQLTFSSTSSAATGLTTVTLTSAGSTDFATLAAGDYITIGGTNNHNGQFQIASVTGNTVSFIANPQALRVSQLLPQTGRNDVTISGTDPQGNQSTFTHLDYGSLTFSPTGTTGGETITAATANSFVDSKGVIVPPAGSIIKLASTTGVNDGTYLVTGNDGTTLTIKSNILTSETNSTTATISSSSYYQGDSLQQSQIIDRGRSVTVGTTAADPAFEKSVRALGILAQGIFGTAGGLDQNKQRISQTLWLLNDALQSPAAGKAPFGNESASDLGTVSQAIGYTQNIITQKNSINTKINGYLQTQISAQENADQTTAITSLLNDSNALQAAYQALAQIRNLTLMSFLK